MNVRFSKRYRSEFSLMLQAIATQEYSTPLTAFWPLVGSKFRSGSSLLVLGRAVNGWQEHGWKTDSMNNPEWRNEIIFELTEPERCRDCPMSWMQKAFASGRYNINRSAFWRTVRCTAEIIGLPTDQWQTHVAWSNLFKIAPWQGGNPSGSLRQMQTSHAVELIRMEIAELDPSVVLVLSGADWFRPFAEGLRLDLQATKRSRFVQEVSTHGGCRWIIGKHPQGKPEWAYVEEISKVLEGKG